MATDLKKQIDELFNTIWRNQVWPDESTNLRTIVNPPTREEKIRELIALAESAGRSETVAYEFASVVAEQAKKDPERAIATWKENHKRIDPYENARAVAANVQPAAAFR